MPKCEEQRRRRYSRRSRPVLQRRPADQEIGVSIEPGREVAGAENRAEPGPGHDERRRQGEISLALDRHATLGQLPIEADAGHFRILGRTWNSVDPPRVTTKSPARPSKLGLVGVSQTQNANPPVNLQDRSNRDEFGQHRHHRQQAIVGSKADLDRHFDDDEPRNSSPAPTFGGCCRVATPSSAISRRAPNWTVSSAKVSISLKELK